MTEPTVREAWNAKLELEKNIENILRDFEEKYSVNIKKVDIERHTFKPLLDSTSTIASVFLYIEIK